MSLSLGVALALAGRNMSVSVAVAVQRHAAHPERKRLAIRYLHDMARWGGELRAAVVSLATRK